MSNVELTTAMTMGSLFDGIGGFPLGAGQITASKRFGPVRSNRSLWK